MEGHPGLTYHFECFGLGSPADELEAGDVHNPGDLPTRDRCLFFLAGYDGGSGVGVAHYLQTS